MNNLTKMAEIAEITDEMRKEAVTDEYGVVYSRDGEWLISAIGCTVQEYWIKEGTKYIDHVAFHNSQVTHLHQPESLEAIGMDAYGFSHIEVLNLPKNLSYIPGVNPFTHCYGVKQVKCESEWFVVEQGLFFSRYRKVLYGAVTNEFPERLILEEPLEVIVNGAFNGRKRLKEVVMPDSVEELGKGSFVRTSLERVRLSCNIKEIPTECFASCKLREVVIPEGVEQIADGAFSENPLLKQVSLPSTLKDTGRDVFAGCPRRGKKV